MGGPVILIIDDDPNIIELLSVNLLASGYEIMTAVDGKDAQAKILQRMPQLIVLDIMMPEIDGWELCKWIRDDSLLKDMKIIMLTAKGTEKDKLIGREILQADEYMTKPFDIDELKKNVERLLHA
jgi:DNA-binding response OmpR family regulator